MRRVKAWIESRPMQRFLGTYLQALGAVSSLILGTLALGIIGFGAYSITQVLTPWSLILTVPMGLGIAIGAIAALNTFMEWLMKKGEAILDANK